MIKHIDIESIDFGKLISHLEKIYNQNDLDLYLYLYDIIYAYFNEKISVNQCHEILSILKHCTSNKKILDKINFGLDPISSLISVQPITSPVFQIK